jgi:hypothetical protein
MSIQLMTSTNASTTVRQCALNAGTNYDIAYSLANRVAPSPSDALQYHFRHISGSGNKFNFYYGHDYENFDDKAGS